MKRLVSILLVLVLSLTLASCSSFPLSIISKKNSFAKGQWENNVYSNTFAGLCLTLPEGWKALSDEEIVEVMELSKELLDEQGKLILDSSNQKSIYDAVIINQSTNSNIFISFENMELTLGGTKYTAQEYGNSLAALLNSSTNIHYTFGKYQKVTLAGKEYLLLPLSFEQNGISMKQDVYIRKVGNFMLTINVTSVSDDKVPIEDLLKPLESVSTTQA